MITVNQYRSDIQAAFQFFWTTRNAQIEKQVEKQVRDQGTRGAVTGGKQMDGFIALLRKIAMDVGIPEDCIYVKGNNLPGFFRPTKDWDFLIVSPKKHLIAVIEIKSQVGSFGNNFNNRTEEALGSAVDLWTAYRENAFPHQQPPWVGYMMFVERSPKSVSPVRVSETHFKPFKEFINASYLDRYKLFCQKLMLERHYTATSVMWTSSDLTFGSLSEEVSLDTFLSSFIGYLQGKMGEFSE